MQTRLPSVALLAFLLAACGRPGQASTPTAVPLSTHPPLALPGPTTLPAQASQAPSAAAHVAAFPDASRFEWAVVASGFESPVDIQFAPDGSGRMFIVEQPGRIRIFAPDAVATGPFLDISDLVETRGNEQGLLGMAFDPQFRSNGHFYVNYTDKAQHNVIARFGLSADPRFADRSSEHILVSIDDPYPNHNGGVLAFGPDGYLYAGMGDGGSANDPRGNGQNRNTLLGKILRLDVDGADPYAIPPDNPFAQGGGKPEVWAYGLRNPWRISFDSTTGDLYIADVGQGQWEEVDFVRLGSGVGLNFGWNYREGAHEFLGVPPPGMQLTDPIAEYSHAEGGCAITGGYVYRGALPEWQGVYTYADYCTGKIWGMLPPTDNASSIPWHTQLLFETHANITTFGQDAAGEVYFADRAGSISRLQRLP